MRITTKVCLIWDEAAQRYVSDPATWEGYEYDGPVALCKGDDAAKQAEQNQLAFQQQLMGIFQQQYGKQSAILDYLSPILKDQISNPQGFSDAAMTTLRTQAKESASNAYTNAQQGLQNKLYAEGMRDLPSGVGAQLEAGLSNAEASQEAGAQQSITLQNEQEKQNNYWRAINALQGNSAQEDPIGYAGAANTAGNTLSNLSQAYNSSRQSGWMGALAGLGGAAFGAAGQAGGFDMLF